MFERLKKSFFDNTQTESYRNDEGELTAYRITPSVGYIIHTIFHDIPVFDVETGTETGEKIKGYTDSYITLRSDYDFEVNPYEIYAVAAPTTNPDTESGLITE